AHRLPRIRDLGPDEHRRPRRRYVPAGALEPVAEDIAPRAIRGADLVDAILRSVQRRDGSDLQGLEGAVVQIALHPGEGPDELRVHAGEADAPTRHVVALRKREELDADLLRSGNLEQARRLIA